MTDYANELRRYAQKLDGAPCTGDTRAVMRLAAAHIEELERRLREAEGHVHALRYIAWESSGYMDAVHAAKRAIGEMGALPPPPKIQPPRGETSPTKPAAARSVSVASG